MKNKNFIAQLLSSVGLIVVTVLFLQPLQKLWMPTMLSSLVLIGLVVVFILFATLMWRESPRDEREEQHRAVAGRVAFLVGAATLISGILIQTMMHKLDSWLLVSLVAMIAAKLLTAWYYQTKQ